MKSQALLSSIAIVSAAIAAPAIAKAPMAHHSGAKLSATLSGANEVNAQGARNQGDRDGTGRFSGRLNPRQGQLCYTLTWARITAPTMAHIHTGAAGVNGAVVVPLDITAGEHCATVTHDLAMALIKNPRAYYVNVHNAAFGGGAVRGQLAKN